MPILGRDGLKTRFRNNIGLEAYKALIESTVNLKDDGLEKNEKDGLKLTLTGSSKKLLSFYERMRDLPSWTISLNSNNQNGLDIADGLERSRIFLREEGNIGIDTSDPRYTLDVAGLVAMEGRVGSYARGYADADGEWHCAIEKEDGCVAYEIMAHINDNDDKRYALTHAIVLLSEGVKGTRRQIKTAQAGSKWLWGRFFNKIVFKWVLNKEASEGSDKNYYDLMIKSRTHYGLKEGRPKLMFYRITKIWDKEYETEFYPTDNTGRSRPVQRKDTSDRTAALSHQHGLDVGGQGQLQSPKVTVKPSLRIKKR